MKKIFIPLILLSLFAASCGDSSNHTRISTGLPRSVRAIPINDGTSIASNNYVLLRNKSTRLMRSVTNFLFPNAIGTSVPTSGDYAMHSPYIAIDVPSLEVMSYPNLFLGALNQTAFWDKSVLNKGPYQAKILWEDMTGPKILTVTVDSSTGKCFNQDATIVKLWMIMDESTPTVQPISIRACSFAQPDEINKYGEWRIDFSYDYQAGYGHGFTEAKIKDGKTYLYIEDNETHTSDYETPRVAGSSLATKVQKGLAILDTTNGDGVVSDDGTITKYSYRGNIVGIYNSSNALTSCANRDPSLMSTYNRTYKVFDSNGMNVKKSRDITGQNPLDFSTILDSGSFTQFDGWSFNISGTQTSNHTNYYSLSDNPSDCNCGGNLANMYNIADGTALVGVDGATYFVRPDYVVRRMPSAAGQCGSLTAPSFDISGFLPFQETGMDSVMPTPTVHRIKNDVPGAELKVEYGVVR